MVVADRNIWRSQRLVVRAIETTDEDFLFSLHSETSNNYQNAAPFLPVPQGTASAKGHREFLQGSMIGCVVCLLKPNKTEAEPRIHPASDDTLEDPIPIGTISLTASTPSLAHHRKTSLGVTIASPYQGKGYGSEVILWALEWAFRHANMHRVEIEAFAYNERAWGLY